MEAAGKVHIIYPAKSDEVRVWHLSDLHLFNKGCAKKRLQQDIDTIRDDPYSFWTGGGDYAEYIGPGDPRFDPDVISDMTMEELGMLGHTMTKAVRDLFMPIKDKCLGLLLGNHELKFQINKQQRQLHDWLCTELGTKNLGYSAFLDVSFAHGSTKDKPHIISKAMLDARNQVAGRRTAIRFFLHHGAGAAQTEGGKMNKLVQFMDRFDADVYMIGHVHDQVGRRLVVLTADRLCTKICEKVKLGIISGSYLRAHTQGVTTYAEVKGYKPVPLGARWVSIAPYTRELRGEI